MKPVLFRVLCLLAGFGLLAVSGRAAAQATITDITLALEKPDGTPTGVWKTQANSAPVGLARLWVVESTPAGNRFKNLHDDPAMLRTDGTYNLMLAINGGLNPADNPAPKAILTLDFAGGSQVQLKLTKGQQSVTTTIGTASVTLRNLEITPYSATTPDWVGNQTAAPDGQHDSPVTFTLVVEATQQPVMVRNGDDSPVPVVVTNPSSTGNNKVEITNASLAVTLPVPAKVEVTNTVVPVSVAGTVTVSPVAAKYDNAILEIRGHNNNGGFVINGIQWLNNWEGPAGSAPPDSLYAPNYSSGSFQPTARGSITKVLQNLSDTGWELVNASIAGNDADVTALLILKRKR